MLDRIIHFSIKNKLIVGLFTVALIGWGSYSFTQLPIDALPDITNNQVQIITQSPSLAAQEVEQFITYPIEQAVKSIPKIVELRSVSRFGLSTITVVFEENTDIYWARAQIGERLRDAEKEIPKGMGSPDLAPISTGLGEIYQYVIYAKPGYEKKYDAQQLRTIQDWIIKPQLTGTPGVAEVNTAGGFLKQYEIAINPDRLKSMNTTIAEVFNALDKNNENTGGAYIDKKPYAYFIRGIGMVTGIPEIEKIVVKTVNNIPILVRDVAQVKEGHAIRYGAVTKDGKGEVVAGVVMMLKGENSAKVVRRVKERIEQIKTSLPEGVGIQPYLDRADLVNRAIATVEKNQVEGALIVIFILVLLIGNMRAGFIVASVIPLSLLFAVCLMHAFGVSGNLMSLGAIDFGLIVDGAVIIVEAIMFRLHNQPARTLNRDEMDNEVYNAASRIRSSAAYGEIVILIVYLPLLTLAGIEGKMFKPMAQTVGFAILGAFILSLTYVPMMSAWLLKRKTGHTPNLSDRIMGFIQKLYTPLLNGALRIKAPVIILSLALFTGALLLFARMGGEFIPTLDEGDIATHVISTPGSSLSQEIDATTQAEKILREKFPEVKMVVSRIGTAEIPTDPMPMEAADVMVILKNKRDWTSARDRYELMQKMERELENIPGITLEFTQPIQMRFNELMTGVRSDVAIKLFGDDIDLLAGYADKIVPVIQSVKGVEDARPEQVRGLDQVTVRYNHDKLALYGLNVGDLNQLLRTAFAGEASGVVYEGEKRFDLVVRLDAEARKDINSVKSLYVTLPSGNQIPLEQVAHVDYEAGPMQVSRDDGKRRIVIGFNVRGRDVESVVKEIKAKLAKEVKLPAGYYYSYGGQFENLVQARARLSIAVPVALALIFVLLFFTFGSVKQSVLIFTAIPLSAIGGVAALWLRGMPFSISAGVGFIALFGVAVLNGIVLIASFNQLKADGVTDIVERIRQGTAIRLRPVMMTAAVASLGFLPMALSTSAGAEVQKPLATVVIGGLITATLLTLVVLPILYYYAETGLGGRSRKRLAATAMVMVFTVISAQAQQQAAPNISLQTAVDSALKHNPGLQAAQLQVEAQRKLQKTAFELPKTELGLQYGEYNSVNQDNAFNVQQSIPFPTVFGARRNLYAAQAEAGIYQQQTEKYQLVYNVQYAYAKAAYLQAVNRQLQTMDSLYTRFVKAAELRYGSGETGMLEKATAQTRHREIQQRLAQNKLELENELYTLAILMGYKGPVNVAAQTPASIAAIAAPDTTALDAHAAVKNIYQQSVIAGYNKKLEAAQTLPEFRVGYFNQSLIGFQNINGSDVYFDRGDRFTGFNFGLSIPLTFFSNSTKLKSYDLQQEAYVLQAQNSKQQLQLKVHAAWQQYLAQREGISYYTQTAIPNAELMMNAAQKGYMNGDTGYLEYFTALQTANEIYLQYEKTLFDLNITGMQLRYLTGTF